MSVLAQRLTYGSLLLGGSLGLLALDHWLASSIGFIVLLTVLVGLGWFEWTRLLGLEGLAVSCGGAILILGIAGLGWIHRRPEALEATGVLLALLPLLLPGVLAAWALRRAPSRSELHRIALAALGVLYLGLPAVCCLQLRWLENGELWVLLLLLVVKGNDIGAYLIGRKWGRTPLCQVSPKKTREGSLAGLLVGMGVASLVAWRGGLPGGVAGGLLVGALAGLAGQVGDLAESFVKRSVGAKDSGALIPAFGGALDLLDSVLFGAPVVFVVAWMLTRVA
ncbi:MAG: phosphatidate cytidylyltransferase [Planctomycetota bacterium]